MQSTHIQGIFMASLFIGFSKSKAPLSTYVLNKCVYHASAFDLTELTKHMFLISHILSVRMDALLAKMDTFWKLNVSLL